MPRFITRMYMCTYLRSVGRIGKWFFSPVAFEIKNIGNLTPTALKLSKENGSMLYVKVA